MQPCVISKNIPCQKRDSSCSKYRLFEIQYIINKTLPSGIFKNQTVPGSPMNFEKIKSKLAILVLFCACSTISFTVLLGPAYVLAKIEIPAWIVIIFLVIYVISVGYFVDKYKITEKMYWDPRRRIEMWFKSTKD